MLLYSVWQTTSTKNEVYPSFGVEEDKLATLATCAGVCRLWFDAAVLLLWAHRGEPYFADTLLETFEPIESERWQSYADRMNPGLSYYLTRQGTWAMTPGGFGRRSYTGYGDAELGGGEEPVPRS
ncbi:hypothetical protein LMH87_001773 [Akanthomyces muscarius]|uniref:Uncharacterized protein n=1 Tax=Akanthomyces muscarius TaxID=2231603 RepID=A0A9W8UHW9_AKAMU|nr:hypothetical protein LMH87_001773 [Akanthomyces muscarius]KAJ4147235.1 hypothetical protein LMH87_001773 [Akanthomyces muscarius]